MSGKEMMNRAIAYLSQGGYSERTLRTRLEEEFAGNST